MNGKTGTDAMPTGTTSGTPQVLLAHHLKQLKLPTVLREYDKVARDCERDYWMMADEAKEYGIVDEVLKASEKKRKKG